MLNRKILIYTIGLIAATELMIYYFWNTPVFIHLFILLLFIPTWIACKKMKILLTHEESWKAERTELEKKIDLLKEETSNYQTRETQLKERINELDAFIFSVDVANHKWFLSKRFQELSPSGTLDIQNGLSIIEDKLHPNDKSRFLQKKAEWLSGTPSTVEFQLIFEEEQVRTYELRTNSLLNSDGDPETVIGLIIDITKRKQKEENLAQMAFYDALTDLPNRTMLKSHLQKALSRARRKEHEVTIMFIDLDGFKDVNDTFGHDIGDVLLKEVATRLNKSVREEDLISRLGGDEFIMVFEETSKDEIAVIADRVLQNISASYNLSENTVSVTPSIGISSYPEDGLEIESLIKNADKAMYFAKSNGKGNYQFYSPDIEEYESKESLIDKFLKLFQSK